MGQSLLVLNDRSRRWFGNKWKTLFYDRLMLGNVRLNFREALIEIRKALRSFLLLLMVRFLDNVRLK